VVGFHLEITKWKEMIENMENISFIKKAKNEDNRLYFECNRSGCYRARDEEIRNLKLKVQEKLKLDILLKFD